MDLRFARTLDHILFFTNKGRVYSSRVYELPEGSRTSKGAHIANILTLQPDEQVTTMLTLGDFEQASYITLLTRKARIKRVKASVLANVRTSGVIAMNLDQDDSLEWAQLTNGNQEFIIVSRGGKALRMREDQVRAMGRTAAGVWAMRLRGDDLVTGFDVVRPGADLFVLHERGCGKRVSLDEYATKGRYIQGVWTTDRSKLSEVGPIIAARVVNVEDQITAITGNGIVLRTAVSGISHKGRPAMGVRIVNLDEGDTVAALAVLRHEDLVRKVEGTEADGDGTAEAAAGSPTVAVAD